MMSLLDQMKHLEYRRVKYILCLQVDRRQSWSTLRHMFPARLASRQFLRVELSMRNRGSNTSS